MQSKVFRHLTTDYALIYAFIYPDNQAKYKIPFKTAPLFTPHLPPNTPPIVTYEIAIFLN